MKKYTLEEARELMTKRAEEYLVAKTRLENLAVLQKSDQNEVAYQVADAERNRAWSLLEDAKKIFVDADRGDDDW